MNNPPLEKAIKIVGSQYRMAKILGKRQSVIWYWLKSGHVSAEFVIPIEQATGGQVTRHELRPDIYPEENMEVKTDASV
jgi:DNA-binding transcriptional regulator YdaS (Cro superfamily)